MGLIRLKRTFLRFSRLTRTSFRGERVSSGERIPDLGIRMLDAASFGVSSIVPTAKHASDNFHEHRSPITRSRMAVSRAPACTPRDTLNPANVPTTMPRNPPHARVYSSLDNWRTSFASNGSKRWLVRRLDAKAKLRTGNAGDKGDVSPRVATVRSSQPSFGSMEWKSQMLPD